MPRTNNTKIISWWIENSRSLQLKKAYTIQQLYSIFKNNTSHDRELTNTITPPSFKRQLGICIKLKLKVRIVKIEETYRGAVKFILLSSKDKSFDDYCFRVDNSKQIVPKKIQMILSPTP